MKNRIRLRLRECLDRQERQTGIRLSYRELASRSGLSYDTVKAIASRPSYNASLRAVERLADALGVSAGELLEILRR